MNGDAPSLRDLLQLSRDWLAARGVTNALREADELAARALGCRRLDLYLEHDFIPSAAARESLRHLLKRRAAGEPLQYLLGTQPFRHAEIRVDSRVLIPRPETEELVELVVSREGRAGPLQILDAGTGSGCVAISLAMELPDARVLAVDNSADALELAGENARANHVLERIDFQRLNMLTSWPTDPVDVLVSNPPYVPLRDRSGLPKELGHEPEDALFGGEDGLIFYRRFATGLDQLLKPGGRFYFEIGDAQGDELLALFSPLCQRVELRSDLSGRVRFLCGSPLQASGKSGDPDGNSHGSDR